MSKVKVLILLAFLLGFYNNVKAQTEDEVIERYLESIGGITQLKTVSSVFSEGKFQYQGNEFPFKTYAKNPGFYKIEIGKPATPFVQSYDGRAGWRIDGFNNKSKLVLLKGGAALSFPNGAEVELESPFIDYHKKGNIPELVSKEKVGDRECLKMKLTRKSGKIEYYFFDGITAHLLLKQSQVKMAGKLVWVDTYFSDFRKIENLLIPFKTERKVKDEVISVATTDKLELNTEIAESQFLP